MNNKSVLCKLLIFTMISLVSFSSKADLPLLVKNLTTDKDNFVLSINSTYQNYNGSEYDLNQPLVSEEMQNNSNQSITPQQLDKKTVNADVFIGNIGLNYGVSKKLELGIDATTNYRDVRISSNKGINKKTDKRLQNVNLTGQYSLTNNHKFFKNSTIHGSVSAYDNTGGLKPKSLSSISLGGTISTTNDPLLLSLSGNYTHNSIRKYDADDLAGFKLKIGDELSMTGSLGFAVNSDITLNTGVTWYGKQANKVNGNKVSTLKTSTSSFMGMGYALSERNTLKVNVSKEISGDGGSAVSVGISSKLGKLPPPLSEKYSQYKKIVEESIQH